MAWFIQDGINNGYPAQDTWRDEWQTGWTSNGNIQYPMYIWRIKQGVNNDYPWLYPWFKENSSDSGEMVIGGSQSNYPSGFTPANRGGIRDDFNDDNMDIPSGGAGANIIMTAALYKRMFAINGGDLALILSALNDPDIFTQTEIDLISKFYGANIFDCFLSCKVFPVDLSQLVWSNGQGTSSVVSSETAEVNAFGKYGLEPNVPLMASSFGFYGFDTITVEPLQAWEIENIDFSIYLPMSGVYPLDIRGVSDVKVSLNVDFINGTGEYYVYVNSQLVGTYRVMMGADVPLNTNQGRMESNMLTNVTSTFARATGAIMGAGFGGIGGIVGANIANTLNPFTEHYAMSTPSVGGLSSMHCYPYPRVIAKIPKMFKDGYGYFETLGANRSTAYVRLAECSGYVKCKNYKTDIIVATDTEKTEIERLMNEGVFI